MFTGIVEEIGAVRAIKVGAPPRDGSRSTRR